jgi:hypothetical protein
MTTELIDFENLDIEPLKLPIGQKIYTASPVGIRDGMVIIDAVAGRPGALNDEPIAELYKLALGPVWDEMVADNVPAAAASLAGMTAVLVVSHGMPTAMAYWNQAVAPAPVVAEAVKPAKTSKAPKRG